MCVVWVHHYGGASYTAYVLFVNYIYHIYLIVMASYL